MYMEWTIVMRSEENTLSPNESFTGDTITVGCVQSPERSALRRYIITKEHTGVYTQTMTELVQAALEEHTKFVLRGGTGGQAGSPILQLPAPSVVAEAIRAQLGLREMDWPG
jgi:hypothetical protein